MGKPSVYDLHLHTEWSYDALSKVEDYFRMAQERRLRAIAITDHHLMDGYGDVLACAEKYPDVRYMSGAELTVHCPLGTFDMVCLGLPRRPEGELVAMFETYRRWQVAFGHAFSENMLRRGFPYDDDARMRLLHTYRAPHIIARQGNTHVRYATQLEHCLREGFFKDKAEYTAVRNGFTGMPDYPEYDYVLPIVKRAGGVVILAHPCDYFKPADPKQLDALREMCQFDGIECAQEGMDDDANNFYRAYCKANKLLSSGGSDLHQPHFTEKFARHGGPEIWLDELLERIPLH